MYVEACAFFDAVVLDCIFDECCAAIGDCFPLDMILDRIAEVVKSFPCLYFHVRLVFRHRHVYVRLSQMTSEVFCASLSGGGKEYRARGSHLRPSFYYEHM